MRETISRVSAIVQDRGGLGAAVRVGVSRPAAVIAAFARVAFSDWRKLASGSRRTRAALQAELSRTGIIERLRRRLLDEFANLKGAEVRGRPVVPGAMRRLHAELLWLLVRARRPKVVVETGVCNGFSSAVLLEALSANEDGQLISVDLPEFTDPALNSFELWKGKGGAAIPAGREVGWLVRRELRSAWRLEIGPSHKILPALLAEIGPVDLFIHDSEHSYDNQLFEFHAAYDALRSGGVLVATDITWSNAFEEFWSAVGSAGARRAFVDPSCAIVVKP